MKVEIDRILNNILRSSSVLCVECFSLLASFSSSCDNTVSFERLPRSYGGQ